MVSAIIVAAGKGVRMKNRVRKQYLLLAGRPVLGHTLLAIHACHSIDNIFLVVPEEDFDYCSNDILPALNLGKKVVLVPGGAQRQDSVYKGLTAIDNTDCTVVIHDGVRPFVSSEQLAACVTEAEEFGACILGFPASDTLKQVDPSGEIDKTIERGGIWQAQTPQAFQYALIKGAHEDAKKEGYTGTDDASLVERLGKKVKIIRGNRFNIKLTTKEDLIFAQAILDTGSLPDS